MTRMIWTAGAAFALLSAGPAAAYQSTSTADSPAAAGDVKTAEKAPDGTTAEERAHTAQLNAAQASRAKAENITYEQEAQAAAREAEAAQQNFAAETAAYEAEKARIAAMSAAERMRFEAEKKQWEADVAACKAGDTSRCAKPAPSTPPKP